MPTNLPPAYFEIEKRYRAARTNEERIACLEEMLSTVPKHKGTEKLIGDLRRRLSKLRTASKSKKSVSRQASAFQIDREGAGQAVVVGMPNVGKSALVCSLTNAAPEVDASPYTTWIPTPGMMTVGNVQIQLIDTPPLNHDFIEPGLVELIRHSDLVLLVIDLQAYPLEQLDEACAILADHRIVPCHLSELATENVRWTPLPFIIVVNKVDGEIDDDEFATLSELLSDKWPLVPVSATTGRNLDHFRQAVFGELEIIRVYSKPPGEEPDLSTPFVLKAGSTVADLAGKVHKDFYLKLKTARLWGSGAFDGQLVGRDHILQDGDIVELRI